MLTNYTVFGIIDGKAEVIDRCVTSMAANNLVKECKELYPNFESFGYVKGNFYKTNITLTQDHDYKEIDVDGTVECEKCGLRNSDPTRNEEIPCK